MIKRFNKLPIEIQEYILEFCHPYKEYFTAHTVPYILPRNRILQKYGSQKHIYVKMNAEYYYFNINSIVQSFMLYRAVDFTNEFELMGLDSYWILLYVNAYTCYNQHISNFYEKTYSLYINKYNYERFAIRFNNNPKIYEITNIADDADIQYSTAYFKNQYSLHFLNKMEIINFRNRDIFDFDYFGKPISIQIRSPPVGGM